MEEVSEADIKALSELTPEQIKEVAPGIEKMVQARVDEINRQNARLAQGQPADKPHKSWYVPAADTQTGIPAAACTCGDVKYHVDVKKLKRWAEKHQEKTGHQMAKRGDKPDV